MKIINLAIFSSLIMSAFFLITLEDGRKLIFRICHGCCLKHRKNAQAFVYKDIPKFDSRLVLQYMPNSKPTFIVIDSNKNELDSHDVSSYSRARLRETVKRYGIKVERKLKSLSDEDEYVDNEDNTGCDDIPILDDDL